jgi:hypothetical protein
MPLDTSNVISFLLPSLLIGNWLQTLIGQWKPSLATASIGGRFAFSVLCYLGGFFTFSLLARMIGPASVPILVAFIYGATALAVVIEVVVLSRRKAKP